MHFLLSTEKSPIDVGVLLENLLYMIANPSAIFSSNSSALHMRGNHPNSKEGDN